MSWLHLQLKRTRQPNWIPGNKCSTNAECGKAIDCITLKMVQLVTFYHFMTHNTWPNSRKQDRYLYRTEAMNNAAYTDAAVVRPTCTF